jgi:hypothetical protein
MSNTTLVDVSDVVVTRELDPLGSNSLAIWKAVLRGQEYCLYETVTKDEFLFSSPTGALTHVRMGLVCLYFRESNDLLRVEPLFVAYAILEALTPIVRKYISHEKKEENCDATFVAVVPRKGDWDLF